ncbi:DUF1217 domain-containing protein [Sagittula salina]|uniref:DUF1217 domain-containing protein n=1 Tax=Sagittula salina TaxID=2820268 RepID=A0A940MRP1_9RHOB|nr:DUF1217 domain-containing protein [Sagittula salina]MBP0484590.1 DUF1217 domain-containing protein [Sagittula salina]
MISVAGLPTMAALKLVEATETKEQALIRKSPQHQREIAYFKENIGSITSVDALTDDYRLYSFVMKAFDLEDQIFGKAMMEKILKSNIEDPKALVNRLTDSRFKKLYLEMGFGSNGEGNINTGLNRWQDRMITRYVDTQYVNGKAEENETLGAALAFRRKASTIRTAFDILKDKELTAFMHTALGLPSQMAALDIDRQARMITDKLDIATLSDPDVVDGLMRKFVALSDATSSNAAENPIVQLVSGGASGSVVMATLDLDLVTRFNSYR